MSTRERWLSTENNNLTIDTINELLEHDIDKLWVAAAAADRVLDDVALQRALISAGLQATETAVENMKTKALSFYMEGEGRSGEVDDDEEADDPVDVYNDVQAHPINDDRDIELLSIRRALLHRSDMLETYEFVSRENAWDSPVEEASLEASTDDPWEEEDAWADPADAQTSALGRQRNSNPFSLSEFITLHPCIAALRLASSCSLRALRILWKRHSNELFPFRFSIMEAIPDYVSPSEYHDLLPAFDPPAQKETFPPETRWRPSLDWVETSEGVNVLTKAQHFKPDQRFPSPSSSKRCDQPLPAQDLTRWYCSRVHHIEALSGMTDVALSLVQYATALGVPDLDELGEDLSLLTRLIYDANHGENEDGVSWTLDRWKSLDNLSVVQAYLAQSTASTISQDTKRLVLPYLFTMEARLERAGQPDSTLSTRLLYQYILSAPLELVSGIFENSKPTLPADKRIIKNDENLARLALACLYGSEALDEWATMSRIYECMPSWDSSENAEDAEDEADTTLASLASFVAPSATRPRCTPSDLLLFFTPLPSVALSRALDVLDVHLESGEILARWNVPAPLRWFLQSASDKAAQRAWAVRMARRVVDESTAEPMGNEDEWSSLLDDMLKLVGSGQGPLRGAFGLLSREEVTRIFFSGLLSSGKFELVKTLLSPSKGPPSVSPQVIEELCLTASRELFDNSSSGNFHHGDMKLAYDCLSVSQITPAIQKEREFIEATSRICSFHVYSRPGILISPLEIRLVKDRLSLVARVLSSTEDAYKHPDVILDLVNKLGFRDDVVAEVKALAMISDSALQSEDFRAAADTCDRMVRRVVDLKKSTDNAMDSTSEVQNDAVEVCWRSCFQLGRQPEFHDTQKKLTLLSHALQLCPPENTLDVLAVWRKVEGEAVRLRKDKKPARENGASTARSRTRGSDASSLVSHLSNFHLSSPTLVSPDAAAMASRTFRSVAANFPFTVRGRNRDSEDAESSRSRSPDVSSHARQAFARGVGWLIGDNDRA